MLRSVFEDCVRIGAVADGSLVVEVSELHNGDVDLERPQFPQCVIDYVCSCDESALDDFPWSFDLTDEVSDYFVAQQLKKYYRTVLGTDSFRSLLYYRSNAAVDSLRKGLYNYKLFEGSVITSSGGVSSGKSGVSHGYIRNRVCLSKAESLNVKLDVLAGFAESVDPLRLVEEHVGFDDDVSRFENVFFNKNLSMSDVEFLLGNISVSHEDDVFSVMLLFMAVLLREGWSVGELRFLFGEWLSFVESVGSGFDSGSLGSSLVWENFAERVEVVELLFAMDSAMPVDLLLKLFLNGNENVRSAVVRNPAVGEGFVLWVLGLSSSSGFDGSFSVGDLGAGSVELGDVAGLRKFAVWNPVLSFDTLSKFFEDEGECVEVRFGALFNESVPSFVKLLHC